MALDEPDVLEALLDALDEPDELLDDDSLFLPVELYRSEYQPPPFKMKAPPPEI